MEYKPKTDIKPLYGCMRATNLEEFFNNKGLKEILTKFFKDPDNKSYINNNEYKELFKNWDPFMRKEKGPSYTIFVLIHFLYLLDINPFKFEDWDKNDLNNIIIKREDGRLYAHFEGVDD